MAAVYFGVVRGNQVDLEGDARLRDGARVEVRPIDLEAAPAVADPEGIAEAERALVRDLLSAGLLDQAPSDELTPDEPFEPLTVRGRPISEQIIEERR